MRFTFFVFLLSASLAWGNEHRLLATGFEATAALPVQPALGETSLRALALDPVRGIIVSDEAQHRLLVLGWGASDWQVFIGGEGYGDRNGPASGARFSLPQGLAVDSSDNLYVADAGNHKIRKIIFDGNVSALAGDGERGHKNGPAASARFNEPGGLIAWGERGFLVADTFNNAIRRIDSNGQVSDYAGKEMGYIDGPIETARFAGPLALCFDPAGNLYVADTFNHAIRKIAPDGQVSTLVGKGIPGYQDGEAGLLSYPLDVAWHPGGFLLIVDAGNHALRVATPQGRLLTALGGERRGNRLGRGDYAAFDGPVSVAVDRAGRIFLLDGGNRRLVLVAFEGS